MKRAERFFVGLMAVVIVLFIVIAFAFPPERPEKPEFIETIVLVKGEEHQVATTGYSLILIDTVQSGFLRRGNVTIEVYYDSEYRARRMFCAYVKSRVENLIIELHTIGSISAEVSLYLK